MLCTILVCRFAIIGLENRTFVWNVYAEDPLFEESTIGESRIEENVIEECVTDETTIEEHTTEEYQIEEESSFVKEMDDSEESSTEQKIGNHPESEKEESTGNEVEDSVERETKEEFYLEKMDLNCICEKVCKGYDFDKNCEKCAMDYKDCDYKMPIVEIQVHQPDGWYREAATVTFTISDTANTGNFEIDSIQAKIGQNGNWTDVTEERKLKISENCSIYVVVIDQKGNTYEQNRTVSCFDTTKPTLNAAISGGILKIQGYDRDSGIKAVSVNGYEFTDFTDSALTIRLQQFDAGYEYFMITAVDQVGNLSEVYQVKNPYYKDPADANGENLAEQLPENAKETKPGNAVGTITEYTKMDANGTTVLPLSKEQEKQGKEFYTIHTASENVFYLVIDYEEEEEKVYFLTEITENDLLNVTSDRSETLPQNSAAFASAIPTEYVILQDSNPLPEETKQVEEPRKESETMEETQSKEDAEQKQENETKEGKEKTNVKIAYFLIGILVIAFLIGTFYFKEKYKKKEDFIEEEDEEELGEYEKEEESENDAEEDFFEEREERE